MNLIKRNKTLTYQFVVFETERCERANGQSEMLKNQLHQSFSGK